MAEGRQDRKSKMGTAVTTKRLADTPETFGETAGRAQKVRMTIEVSPQLHRELTRWTSTLAAELDRPRVTASDAIRAMIRTTLDDDGTAAKVRELLQQR